MSRTSCFVGLVSVVVGLALFVPGAQAQRGRGRGRGGAAQGQAGGAQAATPTAEQNAAARAAYARGQEAFRGADFASAQTAFEEAFAAVPNPVVLLSVAQAQERREDLVGMVATLERYLQLRTDAPDRAAIEQRIAATRARPGLVRVASNPAGASVSVDGAAAGGVTPVDLQLAPGDHEIGVALPSFETATRAVNVSFASRQELSVELTPAPSQMDEDDVFSDEAAEASAEGNDVQTEAVETADTTEHRRQPGVGVWVATGVGAVALVTGSVLGYLALSEQSDFDVRPTAAGADRGELYALMADVSFGVAAAGAITALVLWLTTPTESAETARAAASNALMLDMAPLVFTGGGGASLRGRF